MPVDTSSFQAAALFALSCIAWLPTTHRLGDSVLEFLDHRWDHATAHLISEMAVCNDREACEQRKQGKQGWDETLDQQVRREFNRKFDNDSCGFRSVASLVLGVTTLNCLQ